MTVLGIEWDEHACATARAAGHERLQADVASLDPLDFAPVVRMVGSPPCQAYSRAGNRGGIEDKPKVEAAAWKVAAGQPVPSAAELGLKDERSILVLEPLRWIVALKPRVVALEQVPDVLPLWRLYAMLLSRWGYRSWAGKLVAANYGVPQTRERAFLLASLDGPVRPPEPTHYDPRKGICMNGLKPWVTMAQALGFGLQDAPSGTVMSVNEKGGPRGGGLDGGSGSRKRYADAQREGRWLFRNGNQPNAAVRDAETEPAPTIAFGHNAEGVRWERGALNTGRDWKEGGSREDAQTIDPDRPAPALTAKSGGQWQWERPATTVTSRFALGRPGHKNRNAGEWEAHFEHDSISVNEEEASILQSFRPDYPWQGNKTKRFEQIGNAVPPGMGAAVLHALGFPLDGPGVDLFAGPGGWEEAIRLLLEDQARAR